MLAIPPIAGGSAIVVDEAIICGSLSMGMQKDVAENGGANYFGVAALKSTDP